MFSQLQVILFVANHDNQWELRIRWRGEEESSPGTFQSQINKYIRSQPMGIHDKDGEGEESPPGIV
jgi:hypothetical protein